MQDAPHVMLHASCVAIEGHGVLIKGRSGSGKSALALELMARGAQLVSDDQTMVLPRAGALIACCPPGLEGLIEARGLGILRAEAVREVPLHVIVDMNDVETARLPRHITTQLLNQELPLLRRVDSPHFPAALVQYVKGGAIDPDAGIKPQPNG